MHPRASSIPHIFLARNTRKKVLFPCNWDLLLLCLVVALILALVRSSSLVVLILVLPMLAISSLLVRVGIVASRATGRTSAGRKAKGAKEEIGWQIWRLSWRS